MTHEGADTATVSRWWRRACWRLLPGATTDGPHVGWVRDDCAVGDHPGGRVVMTTKTSPWTRTSGSPRGPAGCAPRERTWADKCAAQNLADVAAMGAVPTAVVVSLTLPGTCSLRGSPSSPPGCP
ncbi:AIR synthase related protein [Kocuria rhizophila]|nr:AIR synthase related protein [Kocuria rhizophila]